MGWYATFQALIYGKGAYGNVKQSLKGEADPSRTLFVALEKISQEVEANELKLDTDAKIRVSYWARRYGYKFSSKDGLNEDTGLFAKPVV